MLTNKYLHINLQHVTSCNNSFYAKDSAKNNLLPSSYRNHGRPTPRNNGLTEVYDKVLTMGGKSKASISPRKKKVKHMLLLTIQGIKRAFAVKYFGLLYDKTLSWNPCLKRIIRKTRLYLCTVDI